MDGPNDAAPIAAALQDLLADGPNAETRRRLTAAARNGGICGRCGRRLAPQETVWRLQLFAGTSPVSARRVYLIAPACAACLPGGEARWAMIPPRRCEGCGRGVIDCCRSGWRRITACCERCRRRAGNRRRAAERPEMACAHCGRMFRPSRTDGRYCPGPCRQKAYRARKTSTMIATAYP